MGIARDAAEERRAQAREKAQKARRGSSHADPPFAGYVNVSLTDEDKRHFDDWMEIVNLSLEIKELVDADNRISLKRVSGTEEYLGSVTSLNAASPDAGKVVTARSSDPTKALYRVVYIVRVVLAGAKWAASAPAEPDRW
jgi:hypothetical protein